MTPSPDTLMHAEDGEYLGVFRPATKASEEAPVAVYKAKLPEEVADIDAYRFHPATVLEDEAIIAGSAVVTVAVERPHKESDGYTHAEAAVAAAGGEAAVDDSVAAVFRNPAQFAHVLESLEGQVPAEVLDMPHDHTNLGAEGVQALGFSATGQSEVLHLELHDDHELAAAA